ncbi:peptidylprolyl isomerase [Sphingomonas cavernae]|uniref:Peptidyl-prolyl cis-trans isomerase n=1 Tax=Sphingomonas cavernae TaxID=2320861 RepID=A0A418WLC2_9SPHN|nr:peptidylprolyl isomerase [Sphingomonas cavernae]RJF90823.1 peptidylprolyl isomerase [Sphingomonas cavernae]
MKSTFLVTALAGLFASQAAVAQDQRPSPAQLPMPAAAPDPATDQQNLVNLDLSSGGRVVLQLRPDVAPNHVARMKALICRGFYDGIIFHRVIDGFMAQAGDPTGTGEGGSDLPDLKAEFNLLPHLRGTVSAARTNDPDTANSQFFIMLMPRTTLDRRYTVYGRVISGMQYVDAIEKGEPPANPSKILKATLAGGCAGVPTAPAPVAPAPAPAAPVATPPAAEAAPLPAEPTTPEEPATPPQ